MASTYSNSGIELITTGEQSGTWGDTTNTNLQIIDRLVNGVGDITLSGTTHTLTTSDGSLSDGHFRVLVFGGTPSGTNTVTITPNDVEHLYFVQNNSGQSVILTQGTGGNITIANGASAIVYCDGAGSGAEVVELSAGFDPEDYLPLSGGTMTGNLNHGDNVKSQFGAGNDLQIYHDGSNSYIKNNTGVMRIHGTEVQIKDEDNNETLAVFNPQGSVDLYYDNSKKLATSSTGADVTGNLLVTGNAESVVNIQGTTAGGSFVNFGDNLDANVGQIGYDHTSNYMRFKTNDTEAMRIDSSGNVGIGTSSPKSFSGQTHLTVNHSSGGTNVSGVSWRVADTEYGYMITYPSNSEGLRLVTTTALPMTFQTNNAERMRIDSSGNVGINTSAQTEKFVVEGAIASTYQATNFGLGDYRVQMDIVSSSKIARIGTISGTSTPSGSQGTLTFLVNDSEKMRIDSSGNVGIGTTSPSTLMHITGNSGSSDGIHFIAENTRAAGGPAGIVMKSNHGDWKIINSQTVADAIEFIDGSAGATRMLIDSSGNLLVGTTSSSTTTQGARLKPSGRGDFTANGGTCSIMNRLTSDGNILTFQKDGNGRGAIGTSGNNLAIHGAGSGDDATGLMFVNSGSTQRIVPCQEGFTLNDGIINLGHSSNRFKDGYFSGTVNAANFNTTSDATLKTNVETLTGSLDAVKALRGVSFDWIDNGNSEVGVIAQEVEAVVPDVVSTDDQGIKSVKYGNLVGVLIEAIKEQQAQIDELKAKLGD